MFDLVNGGRHSLHIRSRWDWNGFLDDDFSSIDAMVHVVDGDTGLGRSLVKRLLDRVFSWERRKQGGVDIEDVIRIARQERIP